MEPIHIHLHLETGPQTEQLSRIETLLEQISRKDTRILMTQQEEKVFLQQMDATTNTIADNIQQIADVQAKVSTEVDELLAKVQTNSDVPADVVDALQSIQTKQQAIATASAAQVAALQAVAAKGSTDIPPVPPVVIEQPPATDPTGAQS